MIFFPHRSKLWHQNMFCARPMYFIKVTQNASNDLNEKKDWLSIQSERSSALMKYETRPGGKKTFKLASCESLGSVHVHGNQHVPITTSFCHILMILPLSHLPTHSWGNLIPSLLCQCYNTVVCFHFTQHYYYHLAMMWCALPTRVASMKLGLCLASLGHLH